MGNLMSLQITITLQCDLCHQTFNTAQTNIALKTDSIIARMVAQANSHGWICRHLGTPPHRYYCPACRRSRGRKKTRESPAIPA